MEEHFSHAWIPFASRLRLWYFDLRIWFGCRFLRQPVVANRVWYTRVVNIGFGYLKYGGPGLCREVEALQYVSSHTRIPVPKVRGAWLDARRSSRWPTCIFRMDSVPGEMLEHVWDNLSDGAKEGLALQLSQHIVEMRSLSPPKHLKGHVCSVYGEAIDDALVSVAPSGPWTSLDEFLAYFMTDIYKYPEPAKHRPAPELVRILKDPAHSPIVFTHADLLPRNIIVKDGRITALIDFQQAGWMPIYWEFLKADVYFEQTPKGWREFCLKAIGPAEVTIAEEAINEIHSNTDFR